MKNLLFLLAAISLAPLHGCAQNASQKKATDLQASGDCEGCEAIYESPVPFDKLDNMVWLPDWKEKEKDPEQPGTKLAVNGIVYQIDGKTPARDIIIYIYHTDQAGIYPKKGDGKDWARRHGYLRGWMKTNEKGEYKFFTLRPRPYPNGNIPAHIHVMIKEPGKTAYWIDDYVFDDDPLLTAAERNRMENRGGNGILYFRSYYEGKSLIKSERHIYLGRNIPGYPKP